MWSRFKGLDCFVQQSSAKLSCNCHHSSRSLTSKWPNTNWQHLNWWLISLPVLSEFSLELNEITVNVIFIFSATWMIVNIFHGPWGDRSPPVWKNDSQDIFMSSDSVCEALYKQNNEIYRRTLKFVTSKLQKWLHSWVMLHSLSANPNMCQTWQSFMFTHRQAGEFWT